MSLFLPAIHELLILGVADPAVPNQERVVLRPTQPINLGYFLLTYGPPSPAGGIIPVDFFYFGNIEVAPPSWIYVYTGPGIIQHTINQPTGEPAYVVHMGRPATVFAAGFVPALVRVSGVAIGAPVMPVQLPANVPPVLRLPPNRR